jgi:hypothetical protein
MSALQEMIQLSKLAVRFVDAVMGPHGGAQNKPGEIRDSVRITTGYDKFDEHVTKTRTDQVRTDLRARLTQLRNEFYQAYPSGPDPWNAGKLNKLAQLAIKYRAGQCNEQVAIAFHHLRGQGVKTIDVAVLQPWPQADHTFLIINLNTPSAVACDPWSPWKGRRSYAATPQNLTQNLQMHHPTGMTSVFTWTA